MNWWRKALLWSGLSKPRNSEEFMWLCLNRARAASRRFVKKMHAESWGKYGSPE